MYLTKNATPRNKYVRFTVNARGKAELNIKMVSLI